MSKEELDIDKEIEKISRKTNIDIRKSEYAFENRIRKLSEDIDKISKEKLKDFDDNKQLNYEYLTTDYSSSSVDKYRKRLKNI